MPSDRDVAEAYKARLHLLDALAATLTTKVEEALDGVGHIDRISFRIKDVESFAAKAAKPKYTDPLTEIEDQVGGRVITFFLDDIPIVRQRMDELFGAVEREEKQPAGPTQFGYESDHLIFVIAEHHKPDGWASVADMPKTFEFQIRTLFMHAWAEPGHDIAYKASDDSTREAERELAWVAASAWGADRALNSVARRLSGTV